MYTHLYVDGTVSTVDVSLIQSAFISGPTVQRNFLHSLQLLVYILSPSL